jgi:hypothetical protein
VRRVAGGGGVVPPRLNSRTVRLVDPALLGPPPSTTRAADAVTEGWSALIADRPRQALTQGNRALELIDPETSDLGWVRLLLAWSAQALKDRDESARQAAGAFEVFSAHGDDEAMGRTLMFIGWLALNNDRADDGGQALERALNHLGAAPDDVIRTVIVAVADLADTVGDPSTAERLRTTDVTASQLVPLALARCSVA